MAIIASSGYQSQSCIAHSMTLAKPLSLSLHLSFPCQENGSKPRTEVHGERTAQDQHESDCDTSLLGASVKPQPKDKDKESPSGFLHKALQGPVSRAVQPQCLSHPVPFCSCYTSICLEDSDACPHSPPPRSLGLS